MKRSLAIVAVLGISTALSGCFLSSSDDTTAAAPAQRAAGPLWKVSLQTKCAGDATQCVAGYGFALTADGKYIVGPGPAGQVATGALTSEEAETLNAKIAALTAPSTEQGANADSASAESCVALTAENNDELTYTREGKQEILAQAKDRQLCFQATNSQAAEELHDLVKDLANRYYPLPFPNACAEQAAALETLYASAQSCNTDADCVYVDESFAAVPPSSDQWVSTDSCIAVKPLAVASVKGLSANQSALTQAYNAALSACSISAQTVTSCDGFMSSAAAPHCQQNLCRAGAVAAQH